MCEMAQWMAYVASCEDHTRHRWHHGDGCSCCPSDPPSPPPSSAPGERLQLARRDRVPSPRRRLPPTARSPLPQRSIWGPPKQARKKHTHGTSQAKRLTEGQQRSTCAGARTVHPMSPVRYICSLKLRQQEDQLYCSPTVQSCGGGRNATKPHRRSHQQGPRGQPRKDTPVTSSLLAHSAAEAGASVAMGAFFSRAGGPRRPRKEGPQ